MHAQIRENISLRELNTFGIQAVARHFASFDSVEALGQILADSHPEKRLLILGGGSNVLLTKDFEGLVLKNEIEGINLISEDEEHVYMRAGSGLNWHQFVLYCLDHNYAGVENLALIPGSVGASPIQNIGAYGVEIKDVFHQLEAYNIRQKKTETFSFADCGFGYRESIFKHQYKGQYVITGVTYRLNKIPVLNTSYGALRSELERMEVKDVSIKEVAQAVINIRMSKLPDWKVLGNAGSFFKNPQIHNDQFNELQKSFPSIVAFAAGPNCTKLAAGWLIEQCGWKGYREGDAGCYEKQALVLVNYGSATGNDIYNLSERIISSVAEKFSVWLEREVNII
jgi:UDP-N-acetylmuramate dehydrogenase